MPQAMLLMPIVRRIVCTSASVVIVRPALFSDETPRLISSRVAISAPTDLPKEIRLRPPEDLTLPLDRSGFEISRIPIGRGTKPEEVAFACAYLCSAPGQCINGSILHLDGGMSMLENAEIVKK